MQEGATTNCRMQAIGIRNGEHPLL